MALTPQNNEAFFREVDEDVRRDQMLSFFTRYGRLIAVAVVLGLVALAGWLWWKAHLAQLAGADSEKLAAAVAPMEGGNSPTDMATLTAVAQSPRAGYRGLGAFALADAAAMKNDAAGAARQYQAIADDQAQPRPIRDLATIRAVTTSFDALPPAQVIERLKALAVPGNAWFGSAGELTALAQLKLGRKDQAAKLFAEIARDKQAPASLRARAAGIATTLGITIDAADANSKG